MNKPREEEKEIDNKIKKLCDEFNYSWKDWEDYFPTGIKKLLDQALSSQLKEVLGVIESKKYPEPMGDEFYGRYNQALDDIKAEVEKLV